MIDFLHLRILPCECDHFFVCFISYSITKVVLVMDVHSSSCAVFFSGIFKLYICISGRLDEQEHFRGIGGQEVCCVGMSLFEC